MTGAGGAGAIQSRDRARGLALALAGVLLYVALHMGFRLLASSTLGEDDTLDQILAQHTGQSVETIARDTERDNFMSPSEALAYGLAVLIIAVTTGWLAGLVFRRN